MGVNWKAFKDQISYYNSFVLVSHIRPDCDALGSELGMAEVLRTVGKKVRIINAHRTPEALQFLDPAGNIEVLGDDIEPEDVAAVAEVIIDKLCRMLDAIARDCAHGRVFLLLVRRDAVSGRPRRRREHHRLGRRRRLR